MNKYRTGTNTAPAPASAWFIYTLLVALLVSVHPATWAQSSVWKVSKGDNYLYLGGTIHMLAAGDYPLPEEFNQAYEDADTLVFETDQAAAAAPAFQARFLSALTYGDSGNLKRDLDRSTYQALNHYLDTRHIPIDTFSAFKPWGASLMITVMEYERLGMDSQYGVDQYFHRRAKDDNKTTLALETGEDQLAALATMEDLEPNRIIQYTLRDLEQLPEFIAFMKNAWRSGNLDMLLEYEHLTDMRVDFPAMYEALLVKRNAAWMQQLPTMVESGSREFVLVGALHLSGEDGLLTALESKGFVIEQL